MRQRRWWFAGLTLTLLAACVGVWKLGGPREQQTARFPYEELPSGAYYGDYAVRKPPDGVQTRARLAIRLNPRRSIPAVYDMFVLHGDSVTKLDRADLLRGLVTIDTPLGAMNYVRAFSNPVVARLIGRPLGIEVRGKDEVDTDWVGAKDDWVAFFAQKGDGAFGVVESKLLLEDASLAPSAGRDGENFKLRRLIIQDNDAGTGLYVVTEEVSRHGDYRLISSKQVTTGKLSAVRWSIPREE